MKNILIVAYHYPPVKVSSAVQRTLKYTKYLLDQQWQSIVLTIMPQAAIAVSDEQLGEVPDKVKVFHAFALDTARHLSFHGRYLSWFALPDRWSSWIPSGFFSGIYLIWKYKPEVIYTTYPMASAHMIGYLLCRVTKIPWVADFRDSMTEEDYPTDPTQRKVFRWIESKTINLCSRAVFTTQGAVDMYSQRYPLMAENFFIIPNGYDEENFQQAEQREKMMHQGDETAILLHSGIIYPSERDPSQFFTALSNLKAKKLLSKGQIKIILRATGHDKHFSQLLLEHDIDDLVFLEPSISYEDALVEMLNVDGLLILQAESCNHQVPAKVYEYMRARKPILALTDIKGDTAKLLKSEKFDDFAALNNSSEIEMALLGFLDKIRCKTSHIPSIADVHKYSRQSRTNELAELLNKVVVA